MTRPEDARDREDPEEQPPRRAGEQDTVGAAGSAEADGDGVDGGGAGGEDGDAEDDEAPEDETRQARAPWHFKVIVVGSVVYLGYRAYQGIAWLAHHL